MKFHNQIFGVSCYINFRIIRHSSKCQFISVWVRKTVRVEVQTSSIPGSAVMLVIIVWRYNTILRWSIAILDLSLLFITAFVRAYTVRATFIAHGVPSTDKKIKIQRAKYECYKYVNPYRIFNQHMYPCSWV